MDFTVQAFILLINFLTIWAAQIPSTTPIPDVLPEIRIQCGSEQIFITIENKHMERFDGMVYPKGLGRNSSCMSVYKYELTPVKYKLPLSACNTMSSNMDDGTIEYYNTIVVQPHRKLVTSQGKGFHVRCKYTTREKLITNDLNVNTLEPTTLLGTAPMPGVTMVIFQGDHVAQHVKLGEPLKLIVSIDTQPVYSMRLSHCKVTDAVNSASQMLIDDDGCSVDPEIMGPFIYNDDGISASVEFQAHKFPYTESVYYHCNVHLCIKTDCPSLPDCSAGKRIKRQSSDEGTPATIEVYSGLYVNEANDLARPDQLDQVRERAIDDPNNICISQRNFAIGIAVAGLILMLMVIAAFLILLGRRRNRKDVSGSSIYSGPYTNTAYSHTS